MRRERTQIGPHVFGGAERFEPDDDLEHGSERRNGQASERRRWRRGLPAADTDRRQHAIAAAPKRPPQVWRVQVDRAQKREVVAELHDAFAATGVVVVAHYAGLTVAQMTDLRRRMRGAGGRVRVAKNRLVKLALEGTEAHDIGDLFSGPTCIAFSDDPVAAPKIAVEFAKQNQNLVILGGAMGTTVLDPSGVESLASLPSLDELRGKLLGLLQAPAGKIAQVVNAPAGKLARVLAAQGQQDAAA